MWELLFGWPKDPSKQVTKIGFFDFISAFVYLSLARYHRIIPGFEDLLSIDWIKEKTIPTIILLSYLVSWLFNFLDFHRRVARKLLRSGFEEQHIFRPLFGDLEPETYKAILEQRTAALTYLFYEPLKKIGGKHLVWQAHNLWTWRYLAISNGVMCLSFTIFAWRYSADLTLPMASFFWFLVCLAVLFFDKECQQTTKRQVKLLEPNKRILQRVAIKKFGAKVPTNVRVLPKRKAS